MCGVSSLTSLTSFSLFQKAEVWTRIGHDWIGFAAQAGRLCGSLRGRAGERQTQRRTDDGTRDDQETIERGRLRSTRE